MIERIKRLYGRCIGAALFSALLGALGHAYITFSRRCLIGIGVIVLSRCIFRSADATDDERLLLGYFINIRSLFILIATLCVADFLIILNYLKWNDTLLFEIINFVVLCITVVVSAYTVIRLYKNGFTFFKK